MQKKNLRIAWLFKRMQDNFIAGNKQTKKKPHLQTLPVQWTVMGTCALVNSFEPFPASDL